MAPLLDDAVWSTWIFGAILVAAALACGRRRAAGELFPREATEELKGFAILAILLAHIGYALV
jgi:hypothetical protein